MWIFPKTFNCQSITAANVVAPRGQLHQCVVPKIKNPMSACAHVVFVWLGNNTTYGCRQSDDCWSKNKGILLHQRQGKPLCVGVSLRRERPFSPKVTHVYQQTISKVSMGYFLGSSLFLYILYYNAIMFCLYCIRSKKAPALFSQIRGY